MKVYIAFLVLLLLLMMIPTYYRAKWNGDSVFIGSDPQIKYYQAYQIAKYGLNENSIYCHYPAEKLDKEFKYFPLGYPWAFILDHKCYFQYPLIFSIAQWLLGGFMTTKLLTYVPIFFYGINIYLTFLIFKANTVPNFFNLFYTTVIHLLTPIFLSTLDYSELSLTNFTLLGFIYCFSNKEKNKVYSILAGIFLVLNFFLRPESTLVAVLYLFISFLFFSDKLLFIKNNYTFLISLITMFLVFSLLNISMYGHFMGMRGMITISDMQSGQEQNYFNNWIADLWGNNYKIGIFQGYPIIFIFILGIYFLKKKELSSYILSAGILMIILLPFISPYRAGVDIFGMRYYESSIYMVAIGFGLKIRYFSKLHYNIIILLIIITSYFGYKSDLRAIKIWTSAADSYHSFEHNIKELNPDIIVHRGLAQSYAIGNSYLLYPQMTVYSQKEFNTLLDFLEKKGIERILYIYWEDNKLFKYEFPEKIWKGFFDIQFEPSIFENQVESSGKILHFDYKLINLKSSTLR